MVASRSHRRVLPPGESRSISIVRHVRACLSTAPRNCLFPWGIRVPSNSPYVVPLVHGEATPVYTPISISIGLSVFAGSSMYPSSSRQTDRQTDHAITSVTIGRIYAMHSVMASKKNYNKYKSTAVELMQERKCVSVLKEQ